MVNKDTKHISELLQYEIKTVNSLEIETVHSLELLHGKHSIISPCIEDKTIYLQGKYRSPGYLELVYCPFKKLNSLEILHGK